MAFGDSKSRFERVLEIREGLSILAPLAAAGVLILAQSAVFAVRKALEDKVNPGR